jgi:hypothetical protein
VRKRFKLRMSYPVSPLKFRSGTGKCNRDSARKQWINVRSAERTFIVAKRSTNFKNAAR